MRWGFAVSMLALTATGCSQPQSTERTPVACAPVAQPEAAKTPVATSPSAAETAKTEATKAETRRPETGKAEPKSAASIAREAGSRLSVKRLVVAKAMNHREPEGIATLFRKSEVDKLYAYVEVENDAKASDQITVSFEPPDGRAARGNVTLDVGSSKRWRTWAYTKNADQIGSWTAVVKDASGKTLARQPFEIAL